MFAKNVWSFISPSVRRSPRSLLRGGRCVKYQVEMNPFKKAK
jgi:hypothetical protein